MSSGFLDPKKPSQPDSPKDAPDPTEPPLDEPVIKLRAPGTSKSNRPEVGADGQRGSRIPIEPRRAPEPQEPVAAEQPIAVEDHEEVTRLKRSAEAPHPKRRQGIPALEGVAQPAPPAMQGESKDWGKAKSHPWRWFAVAAAVVGAVVIGSVILHTRSSIGPSGTPSVALPPREEPQGGALEVQGFSLDGSRQQEARDLIERYAKATTAEEVLPMIRNADPLEDRFRQEWEPWGAAANWKPSARTSWAIAELEGRGFGILSGERPDFSRFRAYFVRENGQLLLDWEATEGRSDASFDELVAGEKGGKARVWVMPVHFYTSEFPYADYQCFRLLSPDAADGIWGYVLRKSEAEAQLLEVFTSNPVDSDSFGIRVTLALEAPPARSLPKQWMIREMLHIEWLTP